MKYEKQSPVKFKTEYTPKKEKIESHTVFKMISSNKQITMRSPSFEKESKFKHKIIKTRSEALLKLNTSANYLKSPTTNNF